MTDPAATVSQGLCERALRAFEVQVVPTRFAATVAAVRIAFGLGLVHRFVAIWGVALVGDDPSATRANALFGAAIGAAVALGVATPLALLATLWFTFVEFRFVHCLGNQVGAIVAWGLLLLGAGRRLAVDAALLRHPRTAAWWRRLYALALEPSPRALAWVRLLLMTMFWGICVGAMVFHFDDPLWLRGTVLQLVMVTPYLTDHAPLFAAFRDAAPGLYDAFFTVGLFVQGAWELLLLPLMLWRWGRWFVGAQGLLFFAFSLVFLNLGYLPFNELCLWLLWFPLTALRRGGVADPGAAAAAPLSSRQSRGLRWLGGTCLAVTLVQLVLNAGAIAGAGWAHAAIAGGGRPWYLLRRTFAQGEVNVFNRDDLMMGAAHAVLYETDADGAPLRVVPLADRDGARLDRVRNDLLYFARSLRWRRRPLEQKFDDGAPAAPTAATREFLQQMVDLDVALTGLGAPRTYRARLFVREMVPHGRFLAWGPPVETAGLEFVVDDGELARIRGLGGPTFWLPPGHFGGDAREAATLAWLREPR
ncbi:MAG: hypothetical protein AB7O97_09215 [Planctomycetota bacterium]